MGLKCKRDKKVTVVDHSWVGHVIEYSLEHFEWFNTLDIKRKKVRYEFSKCRLFFILISICRLKVETKKTIPRGSLQSEDFKTKKIFVGGIRSTLTEGIRLMLLHCCRWRSRQLNQRKSQTSRLHMVVNLGHGRLVIALVVLATLIVVLEVVDMALVPIGFLEVLVVGLVAMVLVLVNSVEDMVVLIED
ncbi:unnamed protein product [Musa hybrid cultivar]